MSCPMSGGWGESTFRNDQKGAEKINVQTDYTVTDQPFGV